MQVLKTQFRIAKLAFSEKLLLIMVLHISIIIIHTSLSIYQLDIEKTIMNDLSSISEYSIKHFVILIIFFFLIKNGLNIIYQIRFFVSAYFGPRFANLLRNRMFEKMNRLNLIYYEDSELFNLVEKAKMAYHYSVTSFTNAYQTLFSHVATVIGVTVYLTVLHPSFIVIIIFAAVPKIMAYIYKGKRRYELEVELAPQKRKYTYYEECLTDQKYYKETRLFGSFTYFKNLWTNTQQMLMQKEYMSLKKLFTMEFLIQLVSFLSYTGTFTLAIYYLYKGDISIGGFTVVLSGLAILDFRLGKIVKNIGKVIEESEIAKEYFNLMDLDEQNPGTSTKPVHPVETITFDHVSFCYPSVRKEIINDLSFNIKKGETIALVGLNGAGKTTLVKLLLGLLHPTDGKIYYNHQDLLSIHPHTIYHNSSSLFQTFARYHMTISDNVGISDMKNFDNKSLINESLSTVEFPLEDKRFSNGLDTMLGKEFGGTDLSYGQWQLLALARAYFRENDLIVLDEPTSSLDPLLEDKIFHRFKALCHDKTAIIVTHRLGVSQIADRIIVLDEGRIIEDGAHEDLMKLKGNYYHLYTSQMKWYIRKETT